MHFERIRTANHPLFEAALSLYRISFPYHEQREAIPQQRIMACPAYRFLAVFDDAGAFTGLILCWETEGFIYVEHFCTLPEKRGKGLGEKALRLLLAEGKTVILEIDPPVDAIAQRRKGFYERCGFSANTYAHTHPPYHEGYAGHPLIVMSAPGTIDESTYRGFFSFLCTAVMQN